MAEPAKTGAANGTTPVTSDLFSGTTGLTFSKADLNVEIETQLTRKLVVVGAWVVTSVLAVVLGAIISVLWVMNGQVNELSGKHTSSETAIQHVEKRIEGLEKENKELEEKIHQKELLDYKNEIEKLKKGNHGN
jgi:predicted RNase H-like nuclease (RuvC/YqgF family)